MILVRERFMRERFMRERFMRKRFVSFGGVLIESNQNVKEPK